MAFGGAYAHNPVVRFPVKIQTLVVLIIRSVLVVVIVLIKAVWALLIDYMIKKILIVIIILASGIYIIGGLVEYSRSKIRTKFLSEYNLGDIKASVISSTNKDMIYIELIGPRHIEKEHVLEGFAKPSRELKEGESVIILKNGIHLYFDKNNKLIHKEMVFS